MRSQAKADLRSHEHQRGVQPPEHLWAKILPQFVVVAEVLRIQCHALPLCLRLEPRVLEELPVLSGESGHLRQLGLRPDFWDVVPISQPGGKDPEPEVTRHLSTDKPGGMVKSVNCRARPSGTAQFSTRRLLPETDRSRENAASVAWCPGSTMRFHRCFI